MQGQSEAGVIFRLSPQQERLWALQRNAPLLTYRAECNFLVNGDLDPQTFRTAVRKVVERHEILRTVYEVDGDALTAHVSSGAHLTPLQEYDLGSLNQEEQGRRIAALSENGGRRGFDLKQHPLLRLTLLRLSPSEHVLIVSQPALCADLVSLKNLVRELSLQYSECLRGGAHVEEPMQYSDFSEWQNELLEAEDMQAGTTFWRRQFVQPLLAVKLPYEKLLSSLPGFTPEVFSLRLTTGRLAQLEQLAEKYQTPLAALLLTCWQVLLSRLTGQPESLVGVASDGRSYGELQGALGLFTKYLPLHAQLEDGLRFHECLSQTADATRALSEWQEYFTWARAAAPDGGLGASAFFPFNFDFEDQRAPADVPPADLSVTVGQWYACLDRFKVKLSCAPTSHSLLCEFHYDSGLFDSQDIARLSREFETLLHSVLADPEIPLRELQVLGERDRQQLLVEFNETGAEHTLGVCIHELFETQAASAPEHSAVLFEGRQLTYRELNRRANQVAHHLRAMGVGPEVLVGILMERSLETVVGLLGILKAGGGYVPLDPSYPLERLTLMLEDAQVPVLLTQERLLENLPASWAQVVCIDSDSALIEARSDENLQSGATAANTAYVIYTSGTTGKPKGVVVEHRGVANLVAWQAANFNITGQSRISQFASYSFDAAVGETFMALLNGATLVMLDREHLEPARLIGSINEHGITVCVLVPSLIKELDPNLIIRPEGLTVVAVGEACPPDLALNWCGKCHFVNAYGPTEYTVYSHLWEGDEEFVSETGRVPIGTPIHNTRSYILDACLNPVPRGVTGEIYISGPGIARGYLNAPGATAERFIPNEFAGGGFTDHGLLTTESVRSEEEEFKRRRASAPPSGDGNRGGWVKAISPEAIFKLVAALDPDLIEKTHRFVRDYCHERAVYEGFCRYLMEGVNGSYASCGINEEVLRHLLPYDSFEGLRGVDVGFGNTEVLQVLAGMGASMTGLDFNPFFVQKGRSYGLDARMAKIDVPPEKFTSESQIEEGSQDFAISTLLLDRLEKPKNSLRNLLRSLKDGGRFAIQTLLPIVGVDDGEIADPIVYTPEQERLTPGNNAEQDKFMLISLLQLYGAGDIEIYQLPYVVSSRDGIQEYTLWSFAGRKQSNPLSADHFRTMYKTGDLGRYLSNGNIEFRGRSDHQVKIRGFRVELGDIEAALLSSPQIKDCVVVTSRNKQGIEQLAAYVVAAEPHSPETSELQALLRGKLPEYMIPTAFVPLDSLPLNPNGKLDRRRLPQPDAARQESRPDYLAPSTPAERALADIWQQVLGLERVGLRDNFFELGGDSILSIQIVARANRAGLRLSPRHLFAHQDIASLAAAAEAGGGAEEEAEQGSVSGPVMLTPVQLWFFEGEPRRPHHFNQSVMLKVRAGTDPAALEAALEHLVGHHDALRLRFARDGEGRWSAHNAGAESLALARIDLSDLAGGEVRAAVEARAREVQASLNLGEGPLVRAVHFELGEGRGGRLLIVIHHLAVDGVSWRILLEDLQRACEQAGRGEAIELGAKGTSFQRWGEVLTGQSRDEGARAEMPYWTGQEWGLALPLPAGKAGAAGRRPAASTARTVTTKLSAEQTRSLLREVPEAYHTRVDEVLLAALGLALGAWVGEGHVVIDLEGHGREEEVGEGVELSRTVGWFTTIYPVLLRTSAGEAVGEALKRVKEQMRGVPRRGIGYGMLKYLSGDEAVREGMRAVPCGEVSFNYLGQFDQVLGGVVEAGAEESGGASQWGGEELRHTLTVNGLVRGGRLEVSWGYSAEVYDEATVEAVAEGYAAALREVIAHCAGAGAGGFTPSDFPESALNQSELDMFISRISRGGGGEQHE